MTARLRTAAVLSPAACGALLAFVLAARAQTPAPDAAITHGTERQTLRVRLRFERRAKRR